MRTNKTLMDTVINSRSGYIDQLVGLRITEYLQNEEHYIPWKTAYNALKYYDKMLRFTEYYGAYKASVNSVL